MQHADVGAHAADHNLDGRQFQEPLFQVGVVEAAITTLVDTFPRVGGELRDNLSLLRALNAVDREHLKLQVVRDVSVADEEDSGATGQLPFQQLLHVGYYAPGIVTAVQGVAGLQEASEHVHHQHYIWHFDIPWMSPPIARAGYILPKAQG